MNNSLSKREKVMLYILLCFLIVIGGFFLIISPMLDHYNQLSDQLGEVNTQKKAMQEAIKAYPDTQRVLASAKESLKKEQQSFYPLMTNEELDKELQKLINQYGLQPVSLTMGDTEKREAQEFLRKKEQTDAGAKEPAPATQEVLINTVTMQVNGTANNIIDLLNSLVENPTLRVTSVDLEMGNLTAVQTFTLNLEVYMMEYIA